jgi:predicted negative regulator of RcsB-dependent stress response
MAPWLATAVTIGVCALIGWFVWWAAQMKGVRSPSREEEESDD